MRSFDTAGAEFPISHETRASMEALWETGRLDDIRYVTTDLDSPGVTYGTAQDPPPQHGYAALYWPGGHPQDGRRIEILDVAAELREDDHAPLDIGRVRAELSSLATSRSTADHGRAEHKPAAAAVSGLGASVVSLCMSYRLPLTVVRATPVSACELPRPGLIEVSMNHPAEIAAADALRITKQHLR